MSQYECGPACLAMIFNYYGLSMSVPELSEKCHANRNGVNALTLKRVSIEIGFDCKALKMTYADISAYQKGPLLLYWDYKHYVVLEKVKNEIFYVLDPAQGRKKLDEAEFSSHFSGIALSFSPTDMIDKKTKSQKVGVKNYFKYIFINPKFTFFLLGVSLILQLIGLGAPFLTQHLIDNATQNNSKLIDIMGLGALLFFLTYLMVSYIRSWTVVKLQLLINEKLSTEFMVHLFKLPMKFFEQRSTGDLATRMNNINTIREILARSGATVILDSMMIIIYGVVMFTYSVTLSLITLAVSVFLIIITLMFVPKLQTYTQKELSTEAESQSYLTESLRAVTLVKTSGNEKEILKGWTKVFYEQQSLFYLRSKLTGALSSIIGSISLAMPIFILWVGARSLVSETFTIGALVAFSTISASFLTPIMSIIGNIQSFQYLGGVFERLYDVMRADPERQDGAHLAQDLSETPISLVDVSFAYNQEEAAHLENISLQVLPGEKIGIVGSTGSGKTTLIKLILGLHTPSRGDVLYGQQNLNELHLHSLRKKMSIVLQDTYLFNDTIRSNISFFQDISEQDVEEAAQLADLDKDIERMPMGYDTIIGENGQNLSGGQRQRLAIARALITKPSLLILDESTSQLDTVTEQRINRKLDEKGVTRVVIAHRLSTIYDSDKILVLEKGRIIQSGSHRSLLDKKGKYSELWEKQMHKSDQREVMHT